MGIYDRDYFRENDDDNRKRRRPKRSGGAIPSGWSAVAIIIFANFGLYFLNQATSGALFNRMALYGSLAAQPLQWYRCLTYGFAHDPGGLMHILCNMFVLFFFGPPLERLYGRREFTWFYLLAVVAGGVAWNILNFGSEIASIGASGAISAVVLLFAMNYPRAQVLIFGIIPTPAWLAGVAYVAYDAFAAHRGNLDGVAHDVHLAGAVFALVYFLLKINFSTLSIGTGRNKKSLKKLFKFEKIWGKDAYSNGSASDSSYSPIGSRWNRSKQTSSADESDFQKLQAEVDRLLYKISEGGEESLTEDERETLRRASREYQKRQNKD